MNAIVDTVDIECDAPVVSNVEFAQVIFADLQPDEYCWTTAFSASPNSDAAQWSGRMSKPSTFDLDSVFNTYFSTALLKPYDRNGETLRRRAINNFSRLTCVVLDDADSCEMGHTWKLETSSNNYQIGFKLSEPIDDVGIARRLMVELAAKGAINSNDRNGNNPVRYVRLPVGTNTKYDPPFKHRLVDWCPNVTVSLDDLIDGLGLDRDKIMGFSANLTKDAPQRHSAQLFSLDNRASDAELIGLIVRGESYHDPLLKLTARYVSRGMSEHDAIDTVEGFMQQSNDGSERWLNRNDDIKRMVREAFIKGFAPVSLKPDSGFIVSAAEFAAQAQSPHFLVEGMLQAGQVYSCTAKWGHGKTAVLLTLAVHIALGKPFAGLRTVKSRVLFMAGENPADVMMRLRGVCLQYGFNVDDVSENMMFTTHSFLIDEKQSSAAHVAKIKEHGHFDVVFIDTLPTHSNLDDDNSNSQMLALAKVVRKLGREIGNPAVVALMHPPQTATKASLRSRGGGAFAGEIDAEILMWLEKGVVEVYHSTKFRGAGFKPFFLKLERVELLGFDDNFGNIATTVVAVPTAAPPPPQDLSPAGQAVFRAYLTAVDQQPIGSGDDVEVSGAELREIFDQQEKENNPNIKENSVSQKYKRGVDDAVKKQRLFKIGDSFVTVPSDTPLL